MKKKRCFGTSNGVINKTIRNASHSGSWYSSNQNKLSLQISSWISNARSDIESIVDSNTISLIGSAKGVISPHAGLSHSGSTAAYAFCNIDNEKIQRIFILGPSHNVYFEGCALSRMTEYDCPLGTIPLDKTIIDELYSTRKFDYMKRKTDEDEHSLEMQLPFICSLMGDSKYTIVPILVGNLTKSAEKDYGHLLSKYLQEEGNFFVISSDFCHWGRHFNYTPHDPTKPIHNYIEELDRRGMKAIESMRPARFSTYLDETENTICGRRSIATLMHMASASSEPYSFKFLQYHQSQKCTSIQDYSVSYAAGVLLPSLDM